MVRMSIGIEYRRASKDHDLYRGKEIYDLIEEEGWYLYGN